MSTLLESVANGWAWKIGLPIEVVATNRFGNVIVKTGDGRYFRIVPEELACELFAASTTQLEENMKEDSFLRDWEMSDFVARAKTSLGPLSAGQVYHLVVPGVLGGAYSEENIRTIALTELLACSGDIARQIDGLPDGSTVKIVVKD